MEMNCKVFRIETGYSCPSGLRKSLGISLLVFQTKQDTGLVSVFDSFDRKFKKTRGKAPFMEVTIERHFLVSRLNLRALPPAFASQNEAIKGKGNL